MRKLFKNSLTHPYMDEEVYAEIGRENRKLQEILQENKLNEYIRKLKIIIGFREHEKYVEEMKCFGRKVLFCTYKMKNSFRDIYLNLLKKHGFQVTLYENISPNPTLSQMLKGVELIEPPDFILALGGGSVIDTAKAISVGIYGDLWDFVEGKAEIKKTIPLVAISTTSGTGSHLTPYAVITNETTLEKKTLKNLLILPKLSIVDLEITASMPKSVIASTGFDVLCHSIEVFTRKDCTKLAAGLSIESIKLIKSNLLASYEGKSIQNKLGMIFADIYAGMALALIGTHVPHAISHPISARFGTSHGQALAYIFPETIKKQLEKNSKELNNKFEFISKLLGGNDIIKTLRDYINALELDNKPAFSEEECENIVKDTLGYRRSSVERSPVPLSDEDIKEIVYKSLLYIK